MSGSKTEASARFLGSMSWKSLQDEKSAGATCLDWGKGFLAHNLVRLTERAFKLGLVGEGDMIRNTEVKHMLPEGGKTNGSICGAHGSTSDSGVHLKCLYTNTHSMRNKWDKLEAYP